MFLLFYYTFRYQYPLIVIDSEFCHGVWKFMFRQFELFGMFASWQLFFLSLIHNFKICVYASLLSLQIFSVVSFFIQTPFHSDGGLSWLKVYYAVVLMFRKIQFGDWVHDFLIWKHSCLTKIDCNKCLLSSTLLVSSLTAQALAATHLLQSVSSHIIFSFFMMHKTNLLRAVNRLWKISDFNLSRLYRNVS